MKNSLKDIYWSKSVVTEEMVDYVLAKYGNKWEVDEPIADVILDDLLQRTFNETKLVKDDKGKGEGIMKDDKGKGKGTVNDDKGKLTIIKYDDTSLDIPVFLNSDSSNDSHDYMSEDSSKALMTSLPGRDLQ
ncbi:hypothetical protein Tco_1240434 [Tanacetum coccineum]